MKKILSFIIATALMLTMSVYAFATTDNIKFNVNLVSETDTQAVITFDYNGGSSFSCLDFEMQLSSRLSVVSGGKSTGLIEFSDYADSQSGAAIAAFNTDSNPLKATFATTVQFKNVKGNDLFTVTLKKSTSAKLTKDDVKVTITNCGILKDNSTTITNLKSTVSYSFDGNANSSAVTSNAQTNALTKNGETTADETVTVAENTATAEGLTDMVTNADGTILSGVSPDYDENEVTDENDTTDKKKIIIIGAGAICCLLVIAAGLIVIAKKYRKNNNDNDNNDNNEE